MGFELLSRSSGILLHPTALPSPYGCGSLGVTAERFVAALAEQGQSVWQVLPSTPTDRGSGYAPYSSPSAFAGNPLWICPERLVQDGMISASDLPKPVACEKGRVNFEAVETWQKPVFDAVMKTTGGFVGCVDFDRFVERHSWLQEYARYTAFKTHFRNTSWLEWPHDIRNRDAKAMEALSSRLSADIRREMVIQYLFAKQWNQLQKTCQELGVHLFGDMPIYVSLDSADVWANPKLFQLGADLLPTRVAGVPPDCFSETGQLWGNPLYDWTVHERTGFAWWLERFHRAAEMYDLVRVDHFRGLVAYWSVPAEEKTAMKGEWVVASALQLFGAVQKAFPQLMVVAEDLGIITDDVREVMKRFGFPGMKILQFAFGDEESKWKQNPYLPQNIDEHAVAYTGTHDNETLAEMLSHVNETTDAHLRSSFEKGGLDDLHRSIVEATLQSAAILAMFPFQDLLRLGSEARFNRPGLVLPENWSWQATEEQLRAFEVGISWFQEALRVSGRMRSRAKSDQ